MPTAERMESLKAIDKSLKEAISGKADSTIKDINASDRTPEQKKALTDAIRQEAAQYDDKSRLRTFSLSISGVVSNA